ncbi:hypothetical protein [Rhodococcus qingshengii]|nr:hypothetical protein AWH04_04545 [Rhodococcus erythropolis]
MSRIPVDTLPALREARAVGITETPRGAKADDGLPLGAIIDRSYDASALSSSDRGYNRTARSMLRDGPNTGTKIDSGRQTAIETPSPRTADTGRGL